MAKTSAVTQITDASNLDVINKKEMVALTNEMLTIFMSRMSGKKNVDVLNIGVNCIAFLISGIVESLSPDFKSQTKIIDAIGHFTHVYHDASKFKKKKFFS